MMAAKALVDGLQTEHPWKRWLEIQVWDWSKKREQIYANNDKKNREKFRRVLRSNSKMQKEFERRGNHRRGENKNRVCKKSMHILSGLISTCYLPGMFSPESTSVGTRTPDKLGVTTSVGQNPLTTSHTPPLATSPGEILEGDSPN